MKTNSHLLDTTLKVGEDEAPLSHTVNDAGKVVVQKDHIRGLFTDIRPRNVHGDTERLENQKRFRAMRRKADPRSDFFKATRGVIKVKGRVCLSRK